MKYKKQIKAIKALNERELIVEIPHLYICLSDILTNKKPLSAKQLTALRKDLKQFKQSPKFNELGYEMQFAVDNAYESLSKVQPKAARLIRKIGKAFDRRPKRFEIDFSAPAESEPSTDKPADDEPIYHNLKNVQLAAEEPIYHNLSLMKASAPGTNSPYDIVNQAISNLYQAYHNWQRDNTLHGPLLQVYTWLENYVAEHEHEVDYRMACHKADEALVFFRDKMGIMEVFANHAPPPAPIKFVPEHVITQEINHSQEQTK